MIRTPWKGILLSSAILALTVVAFAQENNGSPDGLYAVPTASQSSGTVQEQSTSDRSAQSYLSSLDPQGEQFKRDMEKAEAARQAADSAMRLRHAAGGNDASSSWSPNLSERTWLVILVGAGLLASLAGGGYVWWSRIEHSKADATVLLAVRRPPAQLDGAAIPDKSSKRRAA